MGHHEALRLHAIVLWAAAVTVAGTTLAAGLPLASTFAGLARAMPSGKLLYLTAADTAEDDFAGGEQIVLRSLDLLANTTSTIARLGGIPPLGAFWTQAATLTADGRYVVALQNRTAAPSLVPATDCAPACVAGAVCCTEPTNPQPGTCFKVAACSAIPDGPPTFSAVTFVIDVKQGGGRPSMAPRSFTSSQCWSIAQDAADPNKDAVLCLEEHGGTDTYGGFSVLHRVDLATGHAASIGQFPGNYIVDNNVGAFCQRDRVFYAYLANFDSSAAFLFGMNVTTGAVVSRVAMDNVTLLSMDCPRSAAAPHCFAQAGVRSAQGRPEAVFGTLDPRSFGFVPRSAPSLYRNLSLNTGFYADAIDTYIGTAFKGAGTRLWVVGTQAATGGAAFSFEATPADATWVDMAFL